MFSAITILSNVNGDDLLTAISNKDLDFIQNVPGIGGRAANQILLDLGEYIAKSNKENKKQYNEVKDILKALNFKVREIDKVLPGIYIPNGTNEDYVKEALSDLLYIPFNKE